MSQRSPHERSGMSPAPNIAGSFTPMLSGIGTGGPPSVTVTESAFLNSTLRVEITLGGVLGVALFRWSINGGAFTLGVSVGPAAVLAGLLGAPTLNFSAGTYFADNVYTGVI